MHGQRNTLYFLFILFAALTFVFCLILSTKSGRVDPLETPKLTTWLTWAISPMLAGMALSFVSDKVIKADIVLENADKLIFYSCIGFTILFWSIPWFFILSFDPLKEIRLVDHITSSKNWMLVLLTPYAIFMTVYFSKLKHFIKVG